MNTKEQLEYLIEKEKERRIRGIVIRFMIQVVCFFIQLVCFIINLDSLGWMTFCGFMMLWCAVCAIGCFREYQTVTQDELNAEEHVS